MFGFFSHDESAVSAETVKQAIDQKEDVTIIDVRTPQEYAEGHIEGSTLMPLQELMQKVNSLPDKNKKIYLYCRSGARSGQAAQLLKQLGFTDAHNMQGGTLSWSQNGFPLVKLHTS